MIVYLNNNDEIIWLHDNDSIKEKYANDDNCIVVEGTVKYADIPDDKNIYVQKFNRETQEVYAECLGEKPKEEPVEVPVTLKDVKNDTQNTREVTTLTSEDAITIIEYLTVLEEKIDALTALK